MHHKTQILIFVKNFIMEPEKKPVFKSADEIIRLMLESKKQSKIESQERYNTPEFQEILRKLRKMKIVQ